MVFLHGTTSQGEYDFRIEQSVSQNYPWIVSRDSVLDMVEEMLDWFRHLICKGIFVKGLEKRSKTQRIPGSLK